MNEPHVSASLKPDENLLRSEASHRDRCGQAIVQVVQRALVGQQEGKAVGKACKNNGVTEDMC